MDKTKPFGLIIPKKSQSVRPTTSAVFDSDSDDEPVVKKKMPAIPQAKPIKPAPSVDPSIYEYDSIYDDMKAQEVAKVAPKDVNKPSRYIGSLLKAADKRKKDQERRVEKKVHHEREKEGDKFKDKEAFVTSSYKKKMQEMEEEEERERRENMLNEMMDVTKQKDLSGFYRHFLKQSVGEEKVPVFGERYSAKTEVKEEKMSDAEDERKADKDMESSSNEEGVKKNLTKKDADKDRQKRMLKSKSILEENVDKDSSDESQVVKKNDRRASKNDAVKHPSVKEKLLKILEDNVDRDRDSVVELPKVSKERSSKKDSSNEHGAKMLKSTEEKDIDRDYSSASSNEDDTIKKGAAKDSQVKDKMLASLDADLDRDLSDDSSSDVEAQDMLPKMVEDGKTTKKSFGKGRQFRKSRLEKDDNVDQDSDADSSSDAEDTEKDTVKVRDGKTKHDRSAKTSKKADGDSDNDSDDSYEKKEDSKSKERSLRKGSDEDIPKKRKRSMEKSKTRNIRKKTEDGESVSGTDDNVDSSKENGNADEKVAEIKKNREDIFKKRTVGDVFAEAQARYFQRMAGRSG